MGGGKCLRTLFGMVGAFYCGHHAVAACVPPVSAILRRWRGQNLIHTYRSVPGPFYGHNKRCSRVSSDHCSTSARMRLARGDKLSTRRSLATLATAVGRLRVLAAVGEVASQGIPR